MDVLEKYELYRIRFITEENTKVVYQYIMNVHHCCYSEEERRKEDSSNISENVAPRKSA
jgi:hypothetical protein